MLLFDSTIDFTQNHLPKDGEVFYFGKIFSKQEGDFFYEKLMNEIKWENDQAIIYGKKIVTKRKVAWYADKEFEYTYSNITKTAFLWNDLLKDLKKKVEEFSQETFNSCLLNLYHTGEEGMAWHSDGEKDLKKNGAIASLSFGAERKFCFKNNQDNQVISLQLEHGSMMIMKGTTQTHWKHRLPPSKKISEPRINLTFRTIES